MKKIPSPVFRYGGKGVLAKRIIELFGPHKAYGEVYFGGGSLLLNKLPSALEYACDLDPDLMLLWRVLKSPTFIDRLRSLPYDEPTFRWAQANPRDPMATLVMSRFSFAGIGEQFAWSDIIRTSGLPKMVNTWETFKKELMRICSRIQRVDLRCCPALDLIKEIDGPDTLIYCDPPYIHDERVDKSEYDYEMSWHQHAELLDTLNSCRSKVLISGYHSALYDNRLKRWKLHEFVTRTTVKNAGTNNKRIECVWGSK